jgi:hypothetical protein
MSSRWLSWSTSSSTCSVVTVAGQDAYDSKTWHDWYGDKERGVLIHSGAFDGLNRPAAVGQRDSRIRSVLLGGSDLHGQLSGGSPAVTGPEKENPLRPARRERVSRSAVRLRAR